MSEGQVPIRLTQYAKATGCSCKIAPAQLKEIIAHAGPGVAFSQLLVGNESNDDAAVYALDHKNALIATTDFFTPVVDEAFEFGRIAAANALSDIYAMGGKPIMAIAILGWPVDTLPSTIAQQVVEGGRTACADAGIPLAGGHSIIAAEPFFGLCVNGMVAIEDMKKNSTAGEGDLLFLTKAIGSGILTTARKREVLGDEAYEELVNQLTQLNKIGSMLGMLKHVSSMTDVTGFGLLGHLIEMATGSGLSAELYYSKVPIMDGVRELAAQRVVPDATYRNWNGYSAQTAFSPGVNVMEAFNLLPDPQTNGGLLFSVKEAGLQDIQNLLRAEGLEGHIEPIGRLVAKVEKTVQVLP